MQDNHALEPSKKRFPDGGQYRFEIPSVEGPRVFRAVIEAAKEHKVPVHRVSQGSGVLLLQSGRPYTVLVTNRDYNNDTAFVDKPDAPSKPTIACSRTVRSTSLSTSRGSPAFAKLLLTPLRRIANGVCSESVHVC